MTSEPTPIRRTFLHECHLALHARMAPFGGFDMPIQYEGILKEHNACRTACAIFDTCHMGEFEFRGPGALADLERLVSCDVAPMETGQCRYGLLCTPEGTVKDDLLVYRRGPDDFFVVVNAGTQESDFAWMQSHLGSTTRARNLSDETGKVDVQGPRAPRIVRQLVQGPLDSLRFYRFGTFRYRGRDVLVSRTGYTGEIGFEFYGPRDLTLAFWDDCRTLGALPAGLGARDTLRLEMGMPLYGHELSESTPAAWSGLSRAISATKSFIGSVAVRDPQAVTHGLVGLHLPGRRSARHGDRVVDANGITVGTVTSGSFAPSLNHCIALAYVATAVTDVGRRLWIETTRDRLDATVTATPFYTAATGRMALSRFLD